MATRIKIKSTTTLGKVPTTSDLEVAELGINLADKKLYGCNSSEVFEIGKAGEVPSGGTADRPTSPELGDLFYDLTLGAILYWNGAEWVPVGGEAFALGDLSDVDTTGVTDGMVIVYDQASGEWLPASPSSLALDLELNDLTDVDTSGVQNGMILAYNGADWVPFEPATFNVQAGRALSYDTNTDPHTLNADIATKTNLGVVSVGEGLEISLLGELSVTPVDVPPGTVVSENAPANPEAGQLWWADTTEQEGGGRLYVWTGDEWVDTSLPGSGSDFDQATANGLYLSKLNNDTAAGLITFEQGVKVTGGSAAGVDDGLFAGSNFGSPILTASGGGVQLSMDKTGGGETTAHSHGIEVSFADNYIGRENGSTCYGMALGSPKTLSTTRADQQYFGFTSNVGITSAVSNAYCYFGDVSASTGVTDTAAVFYSNADKDENPKAYNFYAARNAPSFFAGLTEHAAGVRVTGVEERSTESRQVMGVEIKPTLSTSGKLDYLGCQVEQDFNSLSITRSLVSYYAADPVNVPSGGGGTVAATAFLVQSGFADPFDGSQVIRVVGFSTNLDERADGKVYNIYSQGTAPNFFKGDIKADADIRVAGFYRNKKPTSALTSVACVSSIADHGNQDVTDSINFVAGRAQNVTGNRLTTVGFQVNSDFNNDYKGGRSAYGFRGNMAADAGGNTYNFFAAGSAPNYFAGNITCDGLINGAFSLRMDTDDPAAFQTTYTTDDEGNQVENQEYIGTSESLLDIIRELRQANQDLEARIAALEGA